MKLTKLLRIFLISLSLTFLMSAVPHLGLSKNLVSPLPTVSAGSDYDQASAYIVVDANSSQILAAKSPDTRLAVASLTKIMTAAAALDLADSKEKFLVSEHAALQIPTKVMLKPGEKYSLEDLIKQMLISSANDSAVVIQEGVDKKFGQNVFIEAMNLKAQNLGLKNTHFTNPAGYDSSGQYSSAEDLSALSIYALNNYPLIKETVARQFEDLTGNKDFRFYLNNWNGLLGVYPGVAGIKIGNTGKANFCTVVIAERAGKKVLVVLLGAPQVLERDLWAAELLDLGFGKAANLPPVNITEADLKAKYASWKYFD